MSSKRPRQKVKSRGPSRPVQARYTTRYAAPSRRPDTFVIGLVGVSTVLVVLIVLWVTTANRGNTAVANPTALANSTSAAAVVPTPINGALPTPNGPQWTATAVAFATETAPLARISAEELKTLQAANNVKLVDVRAKGLYDTKHIKGAVNVPQNDTFTKIKEFPKEGNLVVYCQ